MKIRTAQFTSDLETIVGLNREYLLWATGQLLNEFQQVMPVPDDDTAARGIRAFDSPDAAFFVIEHEDGLVGMGALRTLASGIVELKRMYIQPTYQGKGLGSELLRTLMETATGPLGATTLRLDSCRFMLQAQRLYERYGFVERTPYEGSEIPQDLQKYWRFYEKPSAITH